MMKIIRCFLLFLSPLFIYAQQGVSEEYILRSNETAQLEATQKTFIRTEVSRKQCKVGEPVVITCKYYTRIPTEARPVHYPVYNGFSVIDFNENGKENVEQINGKTYMSYVLQKVQAYAMQPGILTIDPLEADVMAWFIKEEFAHDIFTKENTAAPQKSDYPSNAITEYRFTLTSQAVQINVTPYPVAGRPTDFKGLCGNYRITSAIEKTQMTNKEKNILSVTISGGGNLHLLTAPEINWPSPIEAFDVITEEKIDTYTIPVTGSRTFRYPFTVTDTGFITLPAVSVSYFNIAANQYKFLKCDSLKLSVITAGSASPSAIIEEAKEKNWIARWFSNRVLVISTIAFLITIGLFFWVKKDKKKEQQQKTLEQQQINARQQKIQEDELLLLRKKNPLEKSLQELVQKNTAAFYSTLNTEYKKFLAENFKMPVHEISRKDLIQTLQKNNVSNTLQQKIEAVIDAVEMNLYIPQPDETGMEKVYEVALNTIEEIKQLS